MAFWMVAFEGLPRMAFSPILRQTWDITLEKPSRTVSGVFPQCSVVFAVGLSIGRQKRHGTRFRGMREHGVNGRERSGTP